MSANEKTENLVVVSLPRNPRYARRALRPATDKGAPARETAKSPQNKKVASSGS